MARLIVVKNNDSVKKGDTVLVEFHTDDGESWYEETQEETLPGQSILFTIGKRYW